MQVVHAFVAKKWKKAAADKTENATGANKGK